MTQVELNRLVVNLKRWRDFVGGSHFLSFELVRDFRSFLIRLAFFLDRTAVNKIASESGCLNRVMHVVKVPSRNIANKANGGSCTSGSGIMTWNMRRKSVSEFSGWETMKNHLLPETFTVLISGYK